MSAQLRRIYITPVRRNDFLKVRATQAILECLLEQEVDTVFGYPGGTILNLYDELYNYKDNNYKNN